MTRYNFRITIGDDFLFLVHKLIVGGHKRRLDLFLGHMWSFAFLAIVLVVAVVYDLTVSVCRMSDLRAVPAATVGALYLVGENTHAAVS